MGGKRLELDRMAINAHDVGDCVMDRHGRIDPRPAGSDADALGTSCSDLEVRSFVDICAHPAGRLRVQYAVDL